MRFARCDIVAQILAATFTSIKAWVMKSVSPVTWVFFPILFLVSACAIYKKYEFRDSAELKQLKAGTKLKVTTNQSKATAMSLIIVNDSLIVGNKLSDATPVKIKTSDIGEVWIRSYHDGASRKGFFFGFGLGGSKSFRKFSDGTGYSNDFYSDSKMGVTTEFRIGHAFSDKFALYYRNRNIYSNDYHFGNGNDNETFVTSFTGVGGTYYLRKVAPTFYGNVSWGFGRSTFAFGSGTSYNIGQAVGVGLGYQFARRWNIELDFDFMKLEPNQYSQIAEHERRSLSLTMLYCWFKNYR